MYVCIQYKTHTSDPAVPAASSLGLLDERGQGVSEVGKQPVLQPHGQPKESVQEPREGGGVLL